MTNDYEQLLAVTNLSKSYPGVKALKEINFNLKKGEIRALVGENGAGKTTFVKILGGVVKPDDGIIFFNGKNVRINNPGIASDLGIAIVHQERSLFPNLSIATNLFFSEIDSDNSVFIFDRKLNEKAKKILIEFGLGDISPSLIVRRLEPGQQQLVEIARAAVKNAKLIILDEPTSSLSRRETNLLFSIIKNLKKNGVSIIFVSHRLDEVFELCDSITVFRDGSLIDTANSKSLTNTALIEMILGREEKEMYHSSSSTKKGKEVLKIIHLKIEPKIIDVSFSLHAGEILGIAGLLGSGKTEIVRSIFGLSKMDSGEILINGSTEKIQNPRQAIKLGLGYIPEDRHKDGLILEKSIKDNIILGNLKSYSNAIGWMDLKKENSATEKHRKQLNINTPSIFRYVKFLSGGNQQKVVLSKWLETKPRVFILDDPTRGIDIGAKAEFYKIISKLAEQGVGIIFISSEIQEIISICHRVVVIRNGKINSEFSGIDINAAKLLMSMTGD